ncbi:GvpT/GvpP family gas vesicle accessory protein [Oceanobacillus kapialis]|uniref:GvpT/GvpP family gas vesicle accessory protein n=1 Tax=Oceanobacillus kapialis TaxID=481353 RepID=A0ABW5PXB6_9BACI
MCDKDNQSLPSQQKTPKQQTVVPYALAGGLVGASFGYLASPENGKKIVNQFSRSTFVRAAGREVMRTAQDLLTEQAMFALRQSATGYMQKYAGNNAAKDQGMASNDLENNQHHFQEKYEELKEENKDLQNNLQRIEEKLNKLLEVSSQKGDST